MRIAISQPTYMPWIGYFDLIDQCDTFVILDSVQFEKQSWQQRNRIKTPTGLQWLTVPIIFRGRLGQLINEVVIRTDESQKHLRAIELNYRRAPYFTRYFPEIAAILEKHPAGGLLADLNIDLIRWCCGALDIPTPLLRSSELNQQGRRSELLVNLCRFFKAEFYLSPPGSAVYLLDDLPVFSDAGIQVAFQHFEHPAYRQMFPPFIPYASVIDLLFNEGEDSLGILRSGRRDPLPPKMMANSMVGETA